MYFKLVILLLVLFQGVCLFIIHMFIPHACTPGTKWKEDCRSCSCTKDSKVSCSKQPCSPQLVSRNSRTACSEGESWKEDCHSCFCAHGKPACTRELCESEAPGHFVVLGPSAYETRTKRDLPCKEGDVWKEDCHTCHCARGLKACTRELCLSESSFTVAVPEKSEEGAKRSKRGDEDVDVEEDEDEKCPPNKKEWMEDCNKCYCGDDGLKVCSRALCPDSGGPVVAPMPLS